MNNSCQIQSHCYIWFYIRINISIKRHSTGPKQGARIPFSSDLLNNNKHRTPKKKRQYNFNLYKDGIHPGDLAKAFLRTIQEQPKRDCWTIKQKPTSKAFIQCGFIYAILNHYAYFVTHLTVLHHQQPKQLKSKNMGTPTTNTHHLNYQDAQFRVKTTMVTIKSKENDQHPIHSHHVSRRNQHRTK